MISQENRLRLRQEYDFQCGYCGVREEQVGAQLTMDHYIPVAHGGTDDYENLVYACHTCNGFKSDFMPESPTRRVLHPKRDDFASHIQEIDDGVLAGLSSVGLFHIEKIKLNRPQLVQRRKELQERKNLSNRQRASEARLAALEQEMAILRVLIDSLHGGT